MQGLVSLHVWAIWAMQIMILSTGNHVLCAHACLWFYQFWLQSFVHFNDTEGVVLNRSLLNLLKSHLRAPQSNNLFGRFYFYCFYCGLPDRCHYCPPAYSRLEYVQKKCPNWFAENESKWLCGFCLFYRSALFWIPMLWGWGFWWWPSELLHGGALWNWTAEC